MDLSFKFQMRITYANFFTLKLVFLCPRSTRTGKNHNDLGLWISQNNGSKLNEK